MQTFIKIEKNTRDIVARQCAENGLAIEFFTMEENDQMLLAGIKTDEPVIMWHLGFMVGMKVAEKIFTN